MWPRAIMFMTMVTAMVAPTHMANTALNMGVNTRTTMLMRATIAARPI